MKKLLPWAVTLLALGLAVGLRELWPKEKIIRTPPEIITRTDTVETLDTVEVVKWRERIQRQVDTVNLVREVTVTQVDTIVVLPRTVGITGLLAGEHWADSTIVRGFILEGDTSHISRRDWRTNIFTAGTVEAVVVQDTLPPLVSFRDFPPEPCELGCKLKIIGITGAIALPF